VWAPLDLFNPRPLFSSNATHVLDILHTLWTIVAHVLLLGKFVHDINKLCMVYACNLHCVAIATSPAMAVASVLQVLVRVIRSPLHPLPRFCDPRLSPTTTSMRMVDAAFRAVGSHPAILWVATTPTEDHVFRPHVPQSTIRKIPTYPARAVTTVIGTCLRVVPCVSVRRVPSVIPIDHVAPRVAMIAIVIPAVTGVGANKAAPADPTDSPTKRGAIDASCSF